MRGSSGMFLKGLFQKRETAPRGAGQPEERGPMMISGFDTAGIEMLTATFERRCKICLPGPYRRFLLKYNGGETPNTDFAIGEVSSDLRALYGLGGADPHYHFDKLGRRLSGFLKEGMLPIGENAWGDALTLKVSGEGAGGVYFLYHDRPGDFLPLTGDFLDFTVRCASRPLGHIRSVEERAAALRSRGKAVTPELTAMWEREIAHLRSLHQEPVEF